jgi:DNA polymerase III subunit gamma/tau
MTYQVLARKWRPKIFSEVIGQDHVVRTLKNALQSKKIAHAYLFTGTRGVGKTTIARIFAKSLLCHNPDKDLNPCLTCASCKSIDQGTSIDYTEIDGASNNGVDNIRQLVENVNYLPSNGDYKVYVIDEVHMLSISAFNALLKTLEEPPKHVVFIFATTNPDKLLGTVLSRCQRFDLRILASKDLVAHLNLICTKENIKTANPKIIEKIVKQGRGSARDSLSLFDQVLSISTNSFITDDDLVQSLGIAKDEALLGLVEAMISSDSPTMTDIYWNILKENGDLKSLCLQIQEELFLIIQNIDRLSEFSNYKNNPLLLEKLESLHISELFWLYETIVKDSEWALTSMMPDVNCLIVLQKCCLRNELLDQNVKKKIKISNHLTNETVNSHQAKSIDWNDILQHLKTKNPPLVSNLEHANLVAPIERTEGILRVQLAFSPNSKLSYEYVKEKETYTELTNLINHFIEPLSVELEIKIFEKEEADKLSFVSVAEIKEIEIEQVREQKLKKFLDNPFVNEAERIFNQKIDKIILNSKE